MKVMIRVPNWVGDAVMAEPALRELRRIFGAAQITFVARPAVAELFAGGDYYDEWIAAGEARGWWQGLRCFFQEKRQLSAADFDTAVLLTNSLGTAIIARAAHVRQVAGYATDLRGALLHTRIAFERDYRSKHQVFYYLHIAAEMEKQLRGESRVDFTAATPQLHATAASLDRARVLLETAG